MGFGEVVFAGAYFVFFLTTVEKGEEVSIYLDMGACGNGEMKI